uniref:Putative secreted protein n=1 Tax=Ixodes ricinus TaxID=34613 RepID=A0A6B0TW85_IXORI
MARSVLCRGLLWATVMVAFNAHMERLGSLVNCTYSCKDALLALFFRAITPQGHSVGVSFLCNNLAKSHGKTYTNWT